jgi:2-polyprenyl-6-methoxyphenol hydroxylase-like FAD-dependent oxidoreductase
MQAAYGATPLTIHRADPLKVLRIEVDVIVGADGLHPVVRTSLSATSRRASRIACAGAGWHRRMRFHPPARVRLGMWMGPRGRVSHHWVRGGELLGSG